MKIPEWVKIGKNYDIDEGAIVGYKPSRNVPSLETIIGENARIRSGAVIYAGSRVGDNLETGHGVVIREESVIGDNFSIWNNSTVDYGCKIGNNVKIHCNCYIAQFTTIEDDTFFAPGVVVANDPHPVCTKCMKGPTIKKGARIGINATLLPHIVIGEYSLVGAGSVVTKGVPPKTVACGNPAKVVKSIDELKCPLGLVDNPYKNGRDFLSRELDLKNQQYFSPNWMD
ncbi:UDP-2-acetamido-3-amino-2,3-dideoxy-glucuronate N-acetyltransferase, partial [Candidatus Hakubella thermalkaliphila]